MNLPNVLTAHPRAYAPVRDLLPDVPANLIVEREFALDAAWY